MQSNLWYCAGGCYHPHLHYLGPGGGLSKDRTTWRPSRAHFFVPLKALSPIYRALFKEAMSHAGLLEHIDPQVWTIPWNVHSQATPPSHTAFQYLAPYIFKVAISNSRIVSLEDRTVPFTYRQPRSARPRTTRLDAIEFIRRCLQHVLPDGFMKVRHCGFLHASCTIHTAPFRLMILQAHPIGFQPTRIVPLHRSSPAAQRVADSCGSSCACGLHTELLSIRDERDVVALTISVPSDS